MCAKSCSVLEYTGFVDSIGPNGVVYKPNPNETYFSLTIRHKHPGTVTINEEYVIIDFYGMVGVVGGTLGLFIGFSFFDAITFLMTFFQKVNEHINQRNSMDKITPSQITEVKECVENLEKKISNIA